mmetsp:Transcript_25723/g.59539  ORF Transcript_25723/g.59539 Transcript_25723/m.59539 type:complete len:218 (-) Transcript_25723:644-1297(-)
MRHEYHNKGALEHFEQRLERREALALLKAGHQIHNLDGSYQLKHPRGFEDAQRREVDRTTRRRQHHLVYREGARNVARKPSSEVSPCNEPQVGDVEPLVVVRSEKVDDDIEHEENVDAQVEDVEGRHDVAGHRLKRKEVGDDKARLHQEHHHEQIPQGLVTVGREGDLYPAPSVVGAALFPQVKGQLQETLEGYLVDAPALALHHSPHGACQILVPV